MEKYENILNFWFGDVDDSTVLTTDGDIAQRWWRPSEEVSEQIRDFSSDLNKARKGKYESFKQTPHGCLALVLIYDQVSRHCYPNDPKAYENDLRALEICLESIKKGDDQNLKLYERQFLYLPLIHAENLAIQDKSMEFYQEIAQEAEHDQDPSLQYYKNNVLFTREYYDVIKRFDRFPGRNAALSRRSTQEEAKYLEQEEG